MRESIIVRVSFGGSAKWVVRVLSISEVNFIMGCSACTMAL